MDINKISEISIKTPEKPGEDFQVTVNGMEFRAKTQTGAITLALDYLGEAATGDNLAQFIDLAMKDATPHWVLNKDGILVEASPSDMPPAKPPKKSKGKVEKKAKPEDELIGKVFLGKKGELFRLVAVMPPGDWQFELECLDTDRGTKRLGLKDFKELIPLVPKRTRRKVK